MTDSFFAVPDNTTYSPFTSSTVVIEDTLTPLFPPILPYATRPYNQPYNQPYTTRTTFSNIPNVTYNYGYNYVYNPLPGVFNTIPGKTYYYDSGIGENPLARHEMNVDMRYKFLDKWLYEDQYQNILKMLKVDNGSVKVLSKSASENNDISKDTEAELEKKSDFIGFEILTLNKNRKILDTMCVKNNLKYYDLPYNEKYVAKAQAKYVKGKLEEMQK